MKVFSQTSDLPYDRHQYRFVLDDSRSIVVESYEEIQYLWSQLPDGMNACIEVLDRVKKGKNKGFK